MLTARVLIAAAAVVLVGGLVFAQVPGSQGVWPFGTIVAGNCAKWVNPSFIADAGKTCGGVVTPCTGAVNYSVGCALLGGL